MVLGLTTGKLIKIKGIKIVIILVIINNKVSKFLLTNIYHVLNIKYNLLSII